MINATTIKSAFAGKIGFRQNPDPNGWQLGARTTSTSGLWFNSVHPHLTAENLISIAPRFEQFEGTTEAINEAFTNWFVEKIDDATVAVVHNWINKKLENLTAGNLLSRSKLFNEAHRVTDTEADDGKIVGFEIRPAASSSLVVSIEKVGLQFNTNQTITLKLFQGGQSGPVQTKEFDYTGAGSVQWLPVGWNLDGESTYWLAYHQSDITGLALNGVRDYSFDSKGLTTYPFSRHVDVVGFEAAGADVSALWDLGGNTTNLSTNYGLNLKLSVKCDYTNLVVEQADIFLESVMLGVGLSLLRELLSNPNSRINRNEANISKPQLAFDIDGDRGNRKGCVAYRYDQSIDGIQFDLTGIDKICLPCKRRGTRLKPIGPALSPRSLW